MQRAEDGRQREALTARCRCVFALAIALIALGVPSRASAADPEETPISRTCRLCDRLAPELAIGTPLWVPVVIGTFGYDSSLPPVQIDSSLRFAFVGRLGVRLWGIELQAESFGVGFNSRFEQHPHKLPEIDAFALVSRGIAAYHLPVIAFGRSSRAVLLGFTPYVGARLQRINADLPGSAMTEPKELDLSWWYGVAGLAIDWDFRVGMTLHVEADVGGFKPDSDLSAWGAIRSEFALTHWLGLSAGWNFYRLLHEVPIADLQFRLNGPELALSFYIH
ncbi:MAG TPA: hypothetical protein VFK05_31570 [Polyangiaceae bacterium]|nr:hypothetical protein [Polyangiaceae bacterium]